MSAWTATSSVTWLTLSPINASGNGTLTITAAANTDIARSGSVTITSPGATTQVISVTQAKASTTGFEIKELEQKSYRIVGNTIYFDNTETTVYTILGQPVSAFGNTSVTLPEGIYILNTPLGNEKVIITK